MLKLHPSELSWRPVDYPSLTFDLFHLFPSFHPSLTLDLIHLLPSFHPSLTLDLIHLLPSSIPDDPMPGHELAGGQSPGWSGGGGPRGQLLLTGQQLHADRVGEEMCSGSALLGDVDDRGLNLKQELKGGRQNLRGCGGPGSGSEKRMGWCIVRELGPASTFPAIHTLSSTPVDPPGHPG